jgi:hypothetical protein
MTHPGGRWIADGKLCERKTAHGVDTNRNWPVDWGVKAPDYDPSEEYPGKGPLSEPEASILHDLLQKHTPHAWVNVHSGMEALFMPYDHKALIPDGERESESIPLTVSDRESGPGGLTLEVETPLPSNHRRLRPAITN